MEAPTAVRCGQGNGTGSSRCRGGTEGDSSGSEVAMGCPSVLPAAARAAPPWSEERAVPTPKARWGGRQVYCNCPLLSQHPQTAPALNIVGNITSSCFYLVITFLSHFCSIMVDYCDVCNFIHPIFQSLFFTDLTGVAK